MFTLLVTVFDRIRAFWERKENSRRVFALLLAVFLVYFVCVLLKRLGVLPLDLAEHLPMDPFAAVRFAFTLILVVEFVELIFALSDSVALAAGKQMEIMALLLLRGAFADISLLSSPLVLERDWPLLAQIGITAVSGILLFLIRIFYARWHYIQNYKDMRGYVKAKKCIGLVLLCIFCGALGRDLYVVTVTGGEPVAFHVFCTVLIFADIMLVLVGQYFTPSFKATFRNFGFAVCTLLLRLSLGAPHHVGALICLWAGLYLLALSWSLARFERLHHGRARLEDAIGVRRRGKARGRRSVLRFRGA